MLSHPSNWERIFKLKKKYKLKIINDNCHAMEQKSTKIKDMQLNIQIFQF